MQTQHPFRFPCIGKVKYFSSCVTQYSLIKDFEFILTTKGTSIEVEFVVVQITKYVEDIPFDFEIGKVAEKPADQFVLAPPFSLRNPFIQIKVRGAGIVLLLYNDDESWWLFVIREKEVRTKPFLISANETIGPTTDLLYFETTQEIDAPVPLKFSIPRLPSSRRTAEVLVSLLNKGATIHIRPHTRFSSLIPIEFNQKKNNETIFMTKDHLFFSYSRKRGLYFAIDSE